MHQETAPYFSGEKIMVGLSGGINSMAVLCWLKEIAAEPAELHLFYAHFKEHSPDTFAFVADGIRFARKHFKNVVVKITRNSVLEYFESQNIIPHPANSPCSKILKIIPMQEYCFNNGIKYDLVGYVKNEIKRRGGRQSKYTTGIFDAKKLYFISEFTDEWCFEIVDKYIGWHPAIYDIKDENGKRIFKHNNCLPCKNMYPEDMLAVKLHFPSYHNDAMRLSSKIDRYWGRSKDKFYSTFGRDLGQDSTCDSCKW